MRVLIVSQVFWPDSASVSQHLTDLAKALSSRGHTVEVFSSRNCYEDTTRVYPVRESYWGIDIKRLRQSSFGKRNKIGRALDFFTFNLSLFSRLMFLRKGEFDIIIGTTVPPFSVFFNAVASGLKRICFCHWAMDLQPELSIAAGYLSASWVTARTLRILNRYAFKKANLLITLDSYMAESLLRYGIDPAKVAVIPVWPVLKGSYTDGRLENPFRLKYGFGNKIIVMYSGNHSVVHPLDTILRAAELLKRNERFLFVFIGDGVRRKEVTCFKRDHGLSNIIQLPYQRRDDIHFSLSAADIHVVIQGKGCVGYTHPNKVYGAMLAGRPFLYIGPCPSHITDIIEKCPGNISVAHGRAQELVGFLEKFVDMGEAGRNRIGVANAEFVKANLDKDTLVQKMVSLFEGCYRRKGR